MNFFLTSVINALLVTALSPLIIGVIRKTKARLQGRVGASIFQPYRDMRKLFGKDEVIASDASWIFRLAPYFVFATTLVISAGIPFVLSQPAQNITSGNIFVFAYLLALGTFFLALAGMDTGSSFGGFGSSREMSLSALAEGALVFSLIPLALISSADNFTAIAHNLSLAPLTAFLPVAIAFIAFLIVLVTETGRVPVDNPATHLELTMIHEAMILEYSGRRLALMEWAAANKLFIFIALGSNLFLPWGILILPTTLGAGSIALAVLIFLGKVLAFALGIALLESIIAKLRIFRVPSLIFTALILGAIAIVLTKI